ncbi:NAD-P-binding protein [Trametes versicolor FP-101664 SS1]|uniref:NAD-P-binding protein n=1 Tax=Trametes versicolor (strain FP-101664) TaxID=717944 RepID=UPI0004621CC8|nr:NAD-P-binding protein [Trametes versicolor FP-101664 SS1]EIW54614.1 NAD-P-binding protein [Trametes versicolor FP-101664 SS1]
MSPSASPTTWLVSGTSRGIGFEIVKQLLESPNNLVLAGCRTPEKATALHGLKDGAKGTLHVIQLDVANVDSVRAVPKAIAPILGESGLDHLINNAGMGKEDTPLTLDPDVFIETVWTNTLGPALLTQACISFLDKGKEKKVINISSTLGSVASAHQFDHLGPGGAASYSISKAALNMFTYKLKLERPDLTAITMCPGWVKTDMGTQAADLEPAESVASILKVITSVTAADSGKYLSHKGTVIPW